MILGPVHNAQHSAPAISGGLFSLGIGATVLVYVWVSYFLRNDDEPKPTIGNLVEISLIALVFIGGGIWEILKASAH